jgi:pimeloyl-ACP methyl ester carboxylesterase
MLLLVALVGGGIYWGLHTLTHPVREALTLDPADLLLRVEEATFDAADGVPLSAWFIKGAPGAPAILLCHDLGGSRLTLMNSAVSLNRAGYPLLVFDFRGHGQSGGGGSTLGVGEPDDVRGALAWIKDRKDVDTTRAGLWGIGMGAYAGAMAALEEPTIVALALDTPYATIPAQIDRLVRARVPPMAHGLVAALRPFYDPYFAFRMDATGLHGGMGRLARKNTLIVAAHDSPDRYAESRAIYDALPEGGEADKNFLELRASLRSGLYAEDKQAYDQAIVGFFKSYLPIRGGPAAPRAAPIEVRER